MCLYRIKVLKTPNWAELALLMISRRSNGFSRGRLRWEQYMPHDPNLREACHFYAQLLISGRQYWWRSSANPSGYPLYRVRCTLTLSVFRRTINLMIVVGFCGQYFVIGNAKHIHSFQISWTWGCGATFTVISRLGLVLSKNWCFDRGELWLGDCRKGLKQHETLVGVGKYWFSDIPVGGTPAQIC